ncbi:class I SAM-dependent methyltransferase [Neisseria yangbaofengii]|uniref:class I SAM-dependent methyltransferase n=1 Tax=Neisseria yangbaofengii TaxID=2709396 RepID=UPI0013EA2F96|nr:class I SAM-dependent methyltransferase [Neisseria yangbaofengii]
MSVKISPETVSALSSTMLIPLWAKAAEQSRARPLLLDSEAVRMLDRIDYDFNKFAKAKATQVGCCGRAKLLDDMVRHFIAEYPDAVVVQVGAGLDARYERLGRPRITAWYDLDLPEVIEVRRMLLPESGNHYLGASMFDEAWMHTVAAHGKPVLLVIEGVLMYFEETQVQDFFKRTARCLPNVQFAIDTIPKAYIGQSKHHDALGKMDKPPAFRWAANGTDGIRRLMPDAEIIEKADLSSVCKSRYPWYLRFLYATAWGRRKLDMLLMRIRFPSY